MKKSGKKFTSSHTTTIEVAATVLNFANKHILVDKITLGFITSIPSSRNSNKRIKFIRETACLFVKVRGNRSVQEFRFFTNNIPQFEKEFKKFAKSEGFQTS